MVYGCVDTVALGVCVERPTGVLRAVPCRFADVSSTHSSFINNDRLMICWSFLSCMLCV
jgi:hypothetical protein